MPIIYLFLSLFFAFSLGAQQLVPDLPLITLSYSLTNSAPASPILIGVRNFAGPAQPLSFTVKPSATLQNWLRVASVSSLTDTSDSCPQDPGAYVAFPGSLTANTKDNKLCITAARTAGLPGNYSGFLTLTPSGGSPVQVIVNLSVAPGSFLLLTPDPGTAFNENILPFGAAGPGYVQTVKVEIADPANPAAKIPGPISYSLRPDVNPIDWLAVQCLQQDRKTACGPNPTTPVYFQFSIVPSSSSGQVVARVDIGSLNAAAPGNDVITVSASVTGGGQVTPSSISGQVRVSGGAGLAGVLISLSNGATTATDGSGNFTFGNLTPGSAYTIAPSLSGYAFTPASSTIGSLSGAQTLAFTAIATSPPSGGGALSDAAFVTRLYVYILGRAPEQDGLNFWLGRLSRGDDSRAGVADKFLSSAEYASYGLFIVSDYLGILGREPEIGGYQYWFNQLRALGKPQTDVINGFLASPEYQTRFGNPDVSTFVTSLYRNVLGRAPDPDGFQYWTNLINTSKKTRPEVVQGFVTSGEFQATTLKQLYVEIAYFALLNRAAAPPELTAGKQAIASGQSGPTFLSPIVNGAEFIGRP